MVKIFNDKKSDLFNIDDIVSNRLQTLEAKFSSLIGPVTPDASPRTGPALPSTSARPAPAPRSCKGLFPQIMQDAVCMVCWFSRSFVSEACACFWGMFVRGFVRRDLC